VQIERISLGNVFHQWQKGVSFHREVPVAMTTVSTDRVKGSTDVIQVSLKTWWLFGENIVFPSSGHFENQTPKHAQLERCG